MEQNQKSMQFSINKLELKSLSLTEDAITLTNATSIPNIDFNILPDSRVNLQTKQFVIILTIDAVYKIEDEKRELGKIVTWTEFTIENIEDFIIVKEGVENLILPVHAATALVSIAYSSTRGLLIGKASGTILGIIPLPIIDPRTFTNGPIEQTTNN